MDRDHGLGLSKCQGSGSLSDHFAQESLIRKELCASEVSCESCQRVTCIDGFKVGPCSGAVGSKSARRRRTSDWIREVELIGRESQLGMFGLVTLFYQLTFYGLVFGLSFFLLFGGG